MTNLQQQTHDLKNLKQNEGLVVTTNQTLQNVGISRAIFRQSEYDEIMISP